MSTRRPAPVIVAVVVVGIPAGLAVFTGAYLLIRAPSTEVLLSFVVGLVLLLGLNAMWERRYGGLPLAVFAMVFGVVTPVAYALIAPPGALAIGVSWIAAIVSGIGLSVLFLPGVQAYLKKREPTVIRSSRVGPEPPQ